MNLPGIKTYVPDATLISEESANPSEESPGPDMVAGYLAEAKELLAEIEQAALLLKTLEPEQEHAELINQMFRAFHTLKGSGAMVGFDQVAALAHEVETLLEQVREGRVPASDGLVEIILSATDEFKALLAAEGGESEAARQFASLEKDAPLKKATPLKKAAAKEATVRVPVTRLDRLVNLAGELAMNQSRLSQVASQAGTAEMAAPVEEMERLAAELRDDVLSIRMLPIGTLFWTIPADGARLVSGVGEDVELVAEGGDTELDKSILDHLGDVLMHLLRNCIDHGIEAPSERLKNGKSARGVIRLSAAHAGSEVVIGIEDDGRGINRAAVRAKAVEKRLVLEDAKLSEQETVNLIMQPGFSTAHQVTSISGRGVGMDAVKKQIDALRGTMSLTSQEGRGLRVLLTLPLTLAIIDGLLVEVGGERFIVPIAEVTENVELPSGDRQRNNGRNLLVVRGEAVPYIDLREVFRIAGVAPLFEKVVIVRHKDERVGLVVDRVMGMQQTVIQPLEPFFSRRARHFGDNCYGRRSRGADSGRCRHYWLRVPQRAKGMLRFPLKDRGGRGR